MNKSILLRARLDAEDSHPLCLSYHVYEYAGEHYNSGMDNVADKLFACRNWAVLFVTFSIPCAFSCVSCMPVDQV